MYCKTYELLHNTPEIKKGAIVEANCGDERYVVTNLEEVARYPLKSTSRFTFHRDCVEGMEYWFEELD